ncbi:MAG: hypothetical protein KDG89_06795 [Geminicoccaceae bacterium]|nr:hypothetical protein [Geminicoccaceae bacterium]
MATDADALDLLREHDVLATKRAPFEPLWNELAERVMPSAARVGRRALPSSRGDEVYDATAMNAVPRFAAALESMLVPRASRWHELIASGPRASKDQGVARWLHDLTTRLFRLRYGGRATLPQALHETFLSLGVFGTGIVSIEDVPGETIRYRSVPLQECHLAEGADGLVDTLHRRYALTARQAAAAFGRDLPARIQKLAETEPHREVDLLHVVMPAQGVDPRRRDWRGMPFASVHLLPAERAVVRRAGYRTFPFAVSRYLTSPGDVYGTGPAMLSAPFILLLARAQRSLIVAANRNAEPAWLTHDDDLPPPILTPNALNPGWLDPQGNPLIRPLASESRWDLAEWLFAHWREGVDNAFLGRLFLILEQTPQMTATEVLERVREKGALLAPTAGRQQTELLEPLIARELDILGAAGLLDDMPDVLKAEGGAVDVHYDGPLARAQSEEEVGRILSVAERLATIAQYDPGAVQAIDWREAARHVALGSGLPPALVRTVEQLAAMDAAAKDAAETQAAATAAPGLAGAVKDLAQARSVGGLAA